MVFKKRFTTIPMSCISLCTCTKMGGSTPVVTMVIWIIVERAPALEGKNLCIKLLESIAEKEPRNVNVPWPSQGMGDGDYMYAFQQVVMPIAQEFDPDLVISKCLAACHNLTCTILTSYSCLWF